MLHSVYMGMEVVMVFMVARSVLLVLLFPNVDATRAARFSLQVRYFKLLIWLVYLSCFSLQYMR